MFALIGGFLYYRIRQRVTFFKNLKLFRAEAVAARFDDAINPMHVSTAHTAGGGGQTSFAAGAGAGAGAAHVGNVNFDDNINPVHVSAAHTAGGRGQTSFAAGAAGAGNNDDGL